MTAKINTDAVEELLGNRKKEYQENCLEMGDIAEVLSGSQDPKILEKVNQHIQECELCAKSKAILSDLQAQGVIPPLNTSDMQFVQESKEERKSFFTFRVLALGAAAVVFFLAVISVVFLTKSQQQLETDLVVKGSLDAVHVAVARQEHRFNLRPGDKLIKGDRLGLFYSTDKSGYLAILAVDQAKEVSQLFPADGQQSNPVQPGQKIALADGGIVQDGSGCEWIVGIFSDQAIKRSELVKSIKEAKVDRNNCILEFSVAQARAVRIIPVKR
jgi:hypothetical protein